MKHKRLAISVVVLLLLVPVFGSIVVFAPPPGNLPPAAVDVLVTNTSDDPVPVDIIEGTVYLDLASPVEVANPSGESLGVDVTGWLHTTKSVNWECPEIEAWGSTQYWIETAGYAKITLGASRSIAGLEWFASIAPYQVIGDHTQYPYGIALEEPIILYDPDNGEHSEIITLEVKGERLSLTIGNPSDFPIKAGELRIHYFMTT